MGFRQYGETPLSFITLFSDTGDLPQWALYKNALSGFGADSDPKIYMMHDIFFKYFNFFNFSIKQSPKTVDIPFVENEREMTFAEAIDANLRAVEKNGGTTNHVVKQIDAQIEALQGNPQFSELHKMALMLKVALKRVATMIGQIMSKPQLNETQALYAMFYANKSYGPHTFFENSKYFQLMGVFYNSDLESGYQALWVSDFWMMVDGQRKEGNAQTTLYKIDQSVGGNKCIIGEKAPIITTNKGD